jgi:hypothetical protein
MGEELFLVVIDIIETRCCIVIITLTGVQVGINAG